VICKIRSAPQRHAAAQSWWYTAACCGLVRVGARGLLQTSAGGFAACSRLAGVESSSMAFSSGQFISQKQGKGTLIKALCTTPTSTFHPPSCESGTTCPPHCQPGCLRVHWAWGITSHANPPLCAGNIPSTRLAWMLAGVLTMGHNTRTAPTKAFSRNAPTKAFARNAPAKAFARNAPTQAFARNAQLMGALRVPCAHGARLAHRHP